MPDVSIKKLNIYCAKLLRNFYLGETLVCRR